MGREGITNVCCLFQGRPYTYEQLDLSGLNVMLNSNDVSEYLKISADGLQVTSNLLLLETCTFWLWFVWDFFFGEGWGWGSWS